MAYSSSAAAPSSSVASSQNPLSSETITLAFQLDEFLRSNYVFSKLISNELQQLITWIVRHNFRPPSISRGISSVRDERVRERSQSVEPSWPADWAHDKPSLRAALKALGVGTQELRRLWDPPSTSVTSEESPTDPNNPDNSSGNPTTATTRATSAATEDVGRKIPAPPTPELLSPPSNMAANFLEAQRNKMAAIIAQAMTIANQTAPQPEPRAAAIEARPPQFRLRDVGYFDPSS